MISVIPDRPGLYCILVLTGHSHVEDFASSLRERIYPEYAQFLVKNKIDSISFNPDALVRGIENILIAEKKMEKALN